MAQDGEGIPEHLLGYRFDPKWRDMSNFVVHFTETEENLQSILQEGEIRAGGPFGSVRNLAEVRDSQRSVCLSEIPLDQQRRLMQRHGRYGLGFTRDFIRRLGGARVWYLDQDSRVELAFKEVIRKAMLGGIDPTDHIWQVTPFVDRVMPGRYEFEWEREWRVVGNLRFELSDLAFVLLPEGNKQKVEEEVGLEAPYIHHDGSATGWVAIPEALGTALDRLTAQFLEEFGDPINHLPWDEGEYVWIVDQWSTEDAVDYLFSGLSEGIREHLVDYLNDLSCQWIRISDMDDLAA